MDTYEKFVQDLDRYLRLDLTGYKRPQMERRINTLMRNLGMRDYDHFVESMRKDKAIFERFLDYMTINVSEFFRNPTQWDVLENKIVPELIKKTPNLKVWSAGCSTGEEPYTLSMLLQERFPAGRHSILATDFDEHVLAKAKAGLYAKKNTGGIPAPYYKKYFDESADGVQAKDSLKKIITFRHQNLLRDRFPDNFDLILCRNVVIYFTEEIKRVLYTNFFKALRPGGVLFTGSTEQIMGAAEIGFHSVAVFFYGKPDK
ncbi:MAG: protein-glutamate O-methyltransferase CheR [Peptococcaceae bacterium]|jgi:chemotaxis protein methyltransferase CheR|nr:protein-glutamate O-methyltransferase CheR [Peptococcaceae bacterium]